VLRKSYLGRLRALSGLGAVWLAPIATRCPALSLATLLQMQRRPLLWLRQLRPL
jgi:hypothetical protein